MDWLNFVREILNIPAVVSLLTIIVTLYISYTLAMRRERKLKIVERHSDDLRVLAKRWFNEVPTILFVGQPLESEPTILEAPVEHEYLFEDLKNHIPADMNLLEAWEKFKKDYLQFDENRFSLFQKILKDTEKRLELPYNPNFQKGHGFSGHFVEEIYRDAFRIVRNLRPDNLSLQTRIDKKSPGKYEFLTPSHGLVQGSEKEIKKAERVRREVLSELSSSGYIGQAKQMLEQYEDLAQSREALLRQITDFISIPIFPGDCKYVKWASGPSRFSQILRRRRRIFWIIVTIIIGLCLLASAVWPFTIAPPTEPFEIGAGPCPPCTIDHTQVMVSIPAHTISVTVFFDSCNSLEYHAYVLLPFIVSNVTASVYTPTTGDIPVEALFENLTEYGACIANATYTLSSPEWFPEVRMYMTFHLCSDLEATTYPLGWNFLGSTRAVIITFFGPRGALGWPESLRAYTGRGLNTTLAIRSPLRAHFNIPSGTYLSSESFPTPIQYYMREKQTWIMFSPIFPDNNYAQTIACFFVDPLKQQLKQISLFLAGIVIGVGGGSFIAELVKKKELRESKSLTSSFESDSMPKELENDFLELVKNNPHLDEQDLRILLEKRIERPSKAFFAMVSTAIPVVLGLIALQVFYTLPGFIIGSVFLVYVVVLILSIVRNISTNEVKIMKQYSKAKEFLTDKARKTEKT